MRAFVTFRHIATQPLPESNEELRKEIKSIRKEMDEILADQNDINRRQTESNQVHLNCRGAKEEDGVSVSAVPSAS